jgi:FHA domain
MNIKCTSCACLLSVPDSCFKKAIPKIKCPFCNVFFKPVIKKAGLAHKDTIKPTERVNIGATEKDVTGWLVVHDERTRPQTFSLTKQQQTVGRKNTTKLCDIMIETVDGYMSRNHFIIEVMTRAGGDVVYTLSDSGSMNKTFINTIALNAADTYYLQDGDTIQAGTTKIVFRTTAKVKTAEQATQVVNAGSYNKTVVIK